MPHCAFQIKKMDFQLVLLMEIQLDYQPILFLLKWNRITYFLFLECPQLQIFPFCPFLPIFLSQCFLHGGNKWTQGSNDNSGTKLLPPLPSTFILQQNPNSSKTKTITKTLIIFKPCQWFTNKICIFLGILLVNMFLSPNFLFIIHLCMMDIKDEKLM